MKRRCFAILFAALAMPLSAQTFDLQREVEKATRQTLPAATKSIEQNTDAKVPLEIDAASFGEDAKAWSNLSIVANRIIGALTEIGKDQVGKDAIAKRIGKILIVKLPPDTKEDSVELQGDVVIVRTTASDQAMALLQGVIVTALEKVLTP